MKTLVTGAAGFIGSHVCNHFTKLDHQVIGIDNFDPFYSKKFKDLNIIGLRENAGFQFYEADIRDGKALDKIFSAHKIDIGADVVNGAA